MLAAGRTLRHRMIGPLSSKSVARLRAAGIHLAISIGIAVLVAGLVFALWYPWPYRLVAGGGDLFVLVTTVDVVLGPLLTLIIFNVDKGWPHLRRDLAVIALLQLSALGYGLYTVYIARPVALVFEKDRFRVISAADVYEPELAKAPPEYRSLPLTGPWLLGTRPPQPGQERADVLAMGLQGVDLGQRPLFWQPYSKSREEALKRSRPVSVLYEKYPDRRRELDEALASQAVSRKEGRFLPLVARRDWVVFLHPAGEIAGFAAFDGF